MKQIILKTQARLAFIVALLMSNIIVFAQETKKLDVDINTNGNDSNFLMQPWVWVVGGAVFILLLVALLRNNNKSA